jgi:hypothetical protein
MGMVASKPGEQAQERDYELELAKAEGVCCIGRQAITQSPSLA